jgi:hypothetical protein
MPVVGGTTPTTTVVWREILHLLHDKDGMKSLTRIGSLMSCGLFALSIASALAFDCPNTQKAVMTYCDKTAKVSGVDQVKLTQAKTMLDETMKKHEADNHQGAMTEMAEAMTLITHARS